MPNSESKPCFFCADEWCDWHNTATRVVTLRALFPDDYTLPAWMQQYQDVGFAACDDCIAKGGQILLHHIYVYLKGVSGK